MDLVLSNEPATSHRPNAALGTRSICARVSKYEGRESQCYVKDGRYLEVK